MSAVEISYKGSQIASMDATGVKTLLTGDTFCEDDIVIQYTAPSAPTPTGTKQITITQNGTTTEDVTNYASVEIEVNVSGGGATPLVVTLTENMQGMLIAMDKTVGEIFDAVYDGQQVIFVHDYGSDKICYVAIGAVHRNAQWNVVYMKYSSSGAAGGYATATGTNRTTGHYTFDNPYGSGGL